MYYPNSPNINKDYKIFFDANILIFLFAPSFISTKKHKQYSYIFNILLENKNEIYVNSVVISEFINRCLRIDFEKKFPNKSKRNYKKDYRNSNDYKEIFNIILKQLEKFFQLGAIQINDNFSTFNISKECKNTNLDFNDLIIAKNVLDNNLKLLTDDKDFNNYEGIDTNWYKTI
ncbi:MAG: PIN domain-containing protein [Campylobacteraceae bacterium]|jgi:predicted nucleic acid-binding protein|nr:PIN domain-containing protein [Campylobacteraceae bacterium]